MCSRLTAMAAALGLTCGLSLATPSWPPASAQAALYHIAAGISQGTTPALGDATGRSGQQPTRRRARAASQMTLAKQEMLDLIDAERARAGDGALRFTAALDAIAQARSQDMIDRHYFSHRIPGVGYVFDILDRDHIGYEAAGENIALNNYIDFYNLQTTVERTNTDLMNSPEHRANILDPHYTEIGVGMAFEAGTGKLILTEVFVQPS